MTLALALLAFAAGFWAGRRRHSRFRRHADATLLKQNLRHSERLTISERR